MIKGKIFCLSGSSQNGKSSYAIVEMGRHEREGVDKFIAWDVDGEYSEVLGWKVIRGIDALFAFVRNNGGKPAKISYQPKSQDEFGRFCMIVRAWGEDCQRIGKAGMVVVCEETADVTTPAKAPAGYGELIRRCKKRGIFLYCITQRPAESSKTPYGNADYFITFHLSLPSDRSSVCEYFGVTADQIDQIPRFTYLKKDIVNRKLSKGASSKM